MSNLNKERTNIDKVFENHEPKIIEKDNVDKFYDGLMEEFGRGIWEFGDWADDQLHRAAEAAEILDALGIEQDEDMMGELRNEISKREQKDTPTKDVEETTLATAQQPTSRGRANATPVDNVAAPKMKIDAKNPYASGKMIQETKKIKGEK